MKINRIIAGFLIFTAALVQTASAAEFEDIKGHWAEEAVNALAEKGIVNGISPTEFNPDGIITRAEFLRMITVTVGIGDVEYRPGECLDVPKDAWYAGCIQSALDKGLIPRDMIEDYDVKVEYSNGASRAVYSGKFKPETPITREEIAALTQTAYQYWTNIDTMQGTDHSDEIDFMDLGSVSRWALPYVRLAFAQGFINGMGDENFRPHATATRAQAAVVINRMLNKMN